MVIPTILAAGSPALWDLDVAALRAAVDWLIWLAAAAVPFTLLCHARHQPAPIRRGLVLLALFAIGTGIGLAVRILGGWNATPWSGLAVAGIGWAAIYVLFRYLPNVVGEVGRAGRDDLARLGMLEAAVTASGDGVMIAETTADEALGPRVVYANPAFERITGYSAEEVVGLSPSVFCHSDSAVHRYGGEPVAPNPDAEAEEAALEAIRAALRGTVPVRLELPSRRKDGARVWAEWQIVPVSDPAGRCTHWVAILRDMTTRRRLEEQLRESQKMDAVGRLAGGIAHDFNNLLTVIRGNAELLRDPGAEPAHSPELVDEIRGAAERAAGLVRQLLTFGRRQSARPEILDLNEVVVEMAGMLRRLIGERVTVTTDLSPNPVRTRIDRGQIEQVVMNLVVNARDAMPKGGTLTITTAETAAAPGGSGPGRAARLSVSDTGIGMTPEVRAKIFEPFFTTKEVGKGTGLGLATAYGIVTQAGGRIGVDSTPGVGTIFRVDIPWCDDPSGPKTRVLTSASSSRDRGAGYGRSVLLVEDEEGVRRLTRMALEGCGYAVTEATDGEAALDRLAPDLHYDLLVTDLTMPGMGGRELAARVRAERPTVGVAFISGYASDAALLDSVPGAVFLSKPFTPADLLKAAGRAIARAARITPAPIPAQVP